MGGMKLILLLYSLDACGLLVVVAAQPTVYVWLITPEADGKEGGQVDIRCEASNLDSDHIVAWRTENPEQVLRWDVSTIATESRFMFSTPTVWINRMTVQDFTITNVQRTDSDEYVCTVYKPISSGGNNIVATSSVTLSVLYFPGVSFPMCSHNGPITVDDGTELNMRCLSEIGNPAVTITVSHVPSQSNSYTWTSSTVGPNSLVSYLDFTVDVTDDSVIFECIISSPVRFPDERRSCTIGPISVTTMTIPSDRTTVRPTTMIPSTSDTTASYDKPSSNSAIIAGAVVGGVVIILIVILIVVICLRKGLCKFGMFSKDSKPEVIMPSTDISSNPPENSRQSYNEYAGLESIQDEIQNNRSHVAMVTSYEPAQGTSPTCTTSRKDALKNDAGPIYAKPNKVQHAMDNSQDAGRQYGTTEQTYNNPAFDFTDQDITTPTSEDCSPAPQKPVAMVKPISIKSPIKPKPSQPKSNLPSNITDGNLNYQANQMPSSSPTDPPSIHPVEPHQMVPQSPPYEVTYAEVSGPKRKQGSHDNSESQDSIVYADLDLQSDETDDNCKHLPSADQVVYATIMTT